MDIKSTLNQMIKDRREAYVAHRAKINARAEELNVGWVMCAYNKTAVKKVVSPTWGKDDRPHAPFDGYLWEDPRTGDIDAYGGGQYLPFTDEWDDILKNSVVNELSDLGFWKLRLTEETYESINSFPQIYVEEPYKRWNMEDGTQVFMAKVKAAKEILEFIQEYSNKEIDAIYEHLKQFKGEAPDGKQYVKGKIRSVKTYEDFYGVVSKMTVVLENGATVYGTLPKGVSPNHRGYIEFSATFARAKDDNTHAFFKRPTKCSVEESAE